MNKIITVYELLGLIKDGKAPKKIEYKGDTYIYAGDDYSINDNREDWLITKYDYFLTNFLNEKVEILEEDKHIIEKIEFCSDNGWIYLRSDGIDIKSDNEETKYLAEKLNEIIDYINKGEKNDNRL